MCHSEGGEEQNLQDNGQGQENPEAAQRSLLILSTQPSISSLISHSQTTMECQPAAFSSESFLSSLSMLSSNFFFQKPLWVFGVARPHLGHLCQKHPLTKTAIFCLPNEMSGLPGTAFLCSLYPLTPAFHNADLNASSGPVSFPRLDLIDLETDSELGSGGGPSSLWTESHPHVRE